MPGRPISDVSFAVVDVETTGLYPATDRVLEVAVETIDIDGRTLSRFATLVNPRRDVGPTRVHHVTAAMVRDAPDFSEIAGTLLDQLSGHVVVGHNVAFDLRFLTAEYQRLGFDLPGLPHLCTYSLSRRLSPQAVSHQLACACEAVGVSPNADHTAAGDARATTQLFAALLGRARLEYGCDTLGGLIRACTGDDLAGFPCLKHPFQCRCRTLDRANAETAAERSAGSYVQRLVRRLPASTGQHAEDERLAVYLGLLDRVLEDRIIDEVESENLIDLASEWGLSAEDTGRAHTQYLQMLVAAALEDGVVTESERSDLEKVCHLLGIGPDELGLMLRSSSVSPQGKTQAKDVAEPGSLGGARVCFTGEFAGPDGFGISRSHARELAQKCGVVVTDTFTKAVDVLVVADPDTQSSKARRARKQGTRVIAEAVFWRLLGVGRGSGDADKL